MIRQKGKTYIGTSAGSIIAGPSLPEYLLAIDITANKDLIDATAYEFVNFTILPHWGSDDFRQAYLESKLEVAYKKDQVPLILLTDTQYIHVLDDKIQIIETRR